MRLIPRYSDLINDPPEDASQILKKIPTKTVLFTIAVMNARIDNKYSPPENITFYFRRNRSRFDEIEINIEKFHQTHQIPFSFFSKMHLCRLGIEALKTPNLEIRDTTPEEDYHIFRAYLILVEEYNDEQELVLKQPFNPKLNGFNNLTWPIIAEQYQFVKNRSQLLDIIKTIALIDVLIDLGYSEEVKQYSQLINIPVLDMASNIFSISNKQEILEIDGWETPSFFVQISDGKLNLFESLILDIEIAKEERNFDNNFLVLKKYPLLDHNDDTLVLIDRQFLQNKIYNGFLFDFFLKSGIKSKLRSFDNFKSIIGKDVIERKLFKPLIESIFPKRHQIKIFSEEDSHPDCYLRIHNRVFLIEFKDYMMSSRVINSYDIQTFKDEIDIKFIQNEKGKPKGVTQLANQVKTLSKAEYDFDKIYSNGISKNKLEVYPIIVYTDYQYSIPGINDYLKEKFRENIPDSENFKKVFDPVMINANFMFRYANYISKNRLDNLIKSYFKKKVQLEKKMEKEPKPGNWVNANSSFDDIGVTIDFSKKGGINILEKFLKNIDLKNVL